MTEFSPTSGPGDPAAGADARMKAECAEVIAEVWTLLDGECSAENPGKTTEAPRGMPAMPAVLRSGGANQGVDREQVPRRESPGGPS